MDDDLDLPEGDDINLDLDTPLPETSATPSLKETDDFNLDDFLTEEYKNIPAGEALNPANMFGEEQKPAEPVSLSEETAIAEENIATPEPETENLPAELTESEVVDDSVAGTIQPDLAEKNDESIAPVAESETAVVETADAISENEVAAEGENFEEHAKGWAFDGVEKNTSVRAEPESLEPTTEKPDSGYDMQESAGFAHWFSGNRDDGAFELDRNSLPAFLQGDAEHRVLHVNVGYDTYGWVVQFDNGICMNLRDVREYQLRNGSLPSANGKITYGEMQTEFSAIEKITIYESVRYFTYA